MPPTGNPGPQDAPSSARAQFREGPALPSVVIAAHDEEAVLGACLRSLLSEGVGKDRIVVVANGCSDRTAEVARDHGVVVVEREEPGKAAALNAGDAVAQGFPRIYLDADIVPPAGSLAALVAAFGPGVLATFPGRRLNVAGRPWPVRAYFSINERLPVFREGLFGRGMIAVSEEGRARFATFPELVADDLFLDAQFGAAEKREAAAVTVVVEAPYSTRQLVARLVRVRRGNRQLRSAAVDGAVDGAVRPTDRWAWLREVVLPHPRLWPAAIPYAAITVYASLRARRAPRADAWGRDESTRRSPGTDGGGRSS